MMHSKLMFCGGLLLWLSTSIAAQNNGTLTTNITCVSEFAPVNATGSLPFQILSSTTLDENPGDWIFSTAMLDDRTGRRPYLRTLSYLSLPDSYRSRNPGEILRACVYRGEPYNASWAGQPINDTQSCDGILSANCAKALEDSLSRPVSNSSDCDVSLAARQKIQEECGWGPSVSHNPIDFTNPTVCTASSPPQIAVPEGYRTLELFNQSAPSLEGEPDQTYDLGVRQIVPWVMSAAWSAQSNGQSFSGDQGSTVICIGPGNVTEGSRQPALEPFPSGEQEGGGEDGAAAAFDLNHICMFAILAACATAFIIFQ